MLKRLKDVTLRTKIMGGFGLVLVLLCVVAAVGYYSLSDVVERVHQTEDVNALVRTTLEARQHEKNYVLDPVAETADKVIAAVGMLEKHATELADRFSDAELKAQMLDVAAKGGEYRTGFKTYVDLESQRTATMAEMASQADVAMQKVQQMADGQRAQLKQIREQNSEFMAEKLSRAASVNELLSRVMESKIRVVTMSGKFYESDYIDWRNEYENVLKRADEFHEGFREDEDDKVSVGEFKVAFSAYVGSFEKWYKTRDSATLETVFKQIKDAQMGLQLIRVNQSDALEMGYEETSDLMDDKLAKVNDAGKIITWFKDARNDENAAILHASAESIAKVTGRLDEMAELLDDLASRFEDEADVAKIEEVTASVQAYRAAFVSYMDLMGQQNVAKASMLKSAQAVEQICSSAKDNQSTQMKSRIVTANTVSIGFTGFAVFSGLLLAFFLTKGINAALVRVITGLNDGSNQLVGSANQVSSSSQTLAQGASEQASAIEETSATLEELSATTKQNDQNSGHADQLTAESSETVSRANTTMLDLTQSIEEISKASEETQKIIKTIDEIAFQTNLLALNAAVEAARAGEAGAGFAVVADEVRNLAMRSAEAAQNTASLIEGTVRKVKNGQELVSKTNDEFKEVYDHTEKVSNLVSEISEASNQQAQSVDQINAAVHEMDKVTQQNAAAAEESASASEEMNAQSEQLKSLVLDLVHLVGSNSVENHEPESMAEETSGGSVLALVAGVGNRVRGLIPWQKHQKDDRAVALDPIDDNEFLEY